jgi:hypothetical protein
MASIVFIANYNDQLFSKAVTCLVQEELGTYSRKIDAFRQALFYLSSTIFFNSLPTLKYGHFFGFTDTVFPVFGFLPL